MATDTSEKFKVRVRAAPSPTGRMHTGNLRTFLYNYLWAKHTGGKYVLRIEDTDLERKVDGGVEAIIETLDLYGIKFDEGPGIGGDYGPYVQSERLEIYKKYAEQLVAQGDAYYCFCSKERLDNLRKKQQEMGIPTKYDGHCRNLSPDEVKEKLEDGEPHVIRMKFPKTGFTEFKCEVYGRIRIDNSTIDDQILIKSDGYPTYHFAVVIDDHLMGITHVLRGREYLSQTPKNIFLYNALGWEIPKFAHLPLILNPDGNGKLSKRHGAYSAISYLRKGYLAEAVLNYVALLGWAPKQKFANPDDVYTIDELIEKFTLDRIRKANPRYDDRKLNYINGKHIRSMSIEDLVTRIFDWAENLVLGEFISDKYDELADWEFELREKVRKYLPLWKEDEEYFKKALELVYERMTIFSEIPDLLDFFYDDPMTWTDDDWDLRNHSKEEKAQVLEDVFTRVAKALDSGKNWDHDRWENAVRGYADEIGWKHGEVFMTLRSAITGRLKSPPLLDCMKVLGWKRVEKSVKEAVDWLHS